MDLINHILFSADVAGPQIQIYYMQLLFFLMMFYLLGMLIITQIKQDTSISNFTWGGGVLLVTVYTYFVMRYLLSENGSMFRWRPLLVTLLIIVWAVRLIIYVYLRYKGNDPRYKKWKHKGFRALAINFAYICILQPFVIAIMSSPSYMINVHSDYGFTYLDVIGLLIWAVGYYWEAVSDYQLYRFTQNPAHKGKVMRYGLWRYSRHPNYFGEVLIWWGIFVIALNVPYGMATIIAPATITFLLLFVTGVPWIEHAMEDNPEYQEYKKHTSMFFPGFYKK